MHNLAGWNVLIVEDEHDAHEVLTSVLHHCNAEVESVYTGEEALSRLREYTPTVAIIDLALPGMNGWELFEEMKSTPEYAGIPAVAMTAYHSTSVAQEAINVGFIAYFPKPVNTMTFVEDLVYILT